MQFTNEAKFPNVNVINIPENLEKKPVKLTYSALNRAKKILQQSAKWKSNKVDKKIVKKIDEPKEKCAMQFTNEAKFPNVNVINIPENLEKKPVKLTYSALNRAKKILQQSAKWKSNKVDKKIVKKIDEPKEKCAMQFTNEAKFPNVNVINIPENLEKKPVKLTYSALNRAKKILQQSAKWKSNKVDKKIVKKIDEPKEKCAMPVTNEAKFQAVNLINIPEN
ncbi:uncharacterized protein LOC126548837 isoform X1 [Aphis gossypii]|uniref:uncharacterized protein LOC126548837 isoform X1 n=1 Tax=Aphis gossypii TaxID=80765 RepID=UPI002158E90A|nr:uncharacterized protein LOC126548837 isoform X1 [Aphis gossypii]